MNKTPPNLRPDYYCFWVRMRWCSIIHPQLRTSPCQLDNFEKRRKNKDLKISLCQFDPCDVGSTLTTEILPSHSFCLARLISPRNVIARD